MMSDLQHERLYYVYEGGKVRWAVGGGPSSRWWGSAGRGGGGEGLVAPAALRLWPDAAMRTMSCGL